MELPRGIFSFVNENFGKTLYVLSVLKYVGFILYDIAKGLLPYIMDFFAYYFNIIFLLYYIIYLHQLYVPYIKYFFLNYTKALFLFRDIFD